jgi:hypothetical protein
MILLVPLLYIVLWVCVCVCVCVDSFACTVWWNVLRKSRLSYSRWCRSKVLVKIRFNPYVFVCLNVRPLRYVHFYLLPLAHVMHIVTDNFTTKCR